MVGWMMFCYFLGFGWGYVMGKFDGERKILIAWGKSVEQQIKQAGG